MNIVIGVIGFLKQNRAIPIDPQRMSDFELILNKDCTWEMGIDQSTSCTGIALTDKEKNYVILLDCHRDKKIAKDIFYRELKYLLKRLAANQKYSMQIHERPVPAKYRSAGNVLLELKGRLEDWMYEIPEFENILHDSIYPQSWKSQVIDKSKGKNRFNDKAAIADDLCDRYPILRQYYNLYPYSDYDSFDALGILTGYKLCAFNEAGIQKIWGTQEKTHNSLVCYSYVSIESIKDHTVLDKLFGQVLSFYAPKFLAYNMAFNLHDNVRMASSNNRAVYTVLPDNVAQDLQWTYDFDNEDETKCMLMFVFRKGDFTTSSIHVLEKIFPWNEVICGGL